MTSLTLASIQTQLNLYGYPVLLVLGNIGNAFIIIRFSKQRQNACSLYLLCSAIMNSIYLALGSFSRLLPIYYGDATSFKLALCKINFYLQNATSITAKTTLVFACIDRFLITSNRVSLRALSTTKRAKYFIFFNIIFWLLSAIYVLVMLNIINGQCAIASGFNLIFSTTYTVIFVGLLPPITSGIFGYLTYRNMRQMHARVQPVGNNATNANAAIRPRDRELLILVLSEVFVYVVLASLFPIIRVETTISDSILSNKSAQYIQIEWFITSIAYFLIFTNSAAPFYIYVIASKTFRHDFKELIINGYRKLRRQPTIPVAFRRNEPVAQRETRV